MSAVVGFLAVANLILVGMVAWQSWHHEQVVAKLARYRDQLDRSQAENHALREELALREAQSRGRSASDLVRPNWEPRR